MQKIHKRYDVNKMADISPAQKFEIQIGGAFAPLVQLETEDIEEAYASFKETTCKITEEIVGFKLRKQVIGLPADVETVCEQRRKARTEMLNSPNDTVKAKR